MKELWAIKYRPTNAEEFICTTEEQKNLINQIIETKNIPHLLLEGKHGTGKTSLAYLIKNICSIDDVDFLKLNASEENSIDTIRSKVKTFISTYAMDNFKIVFLDEADWLTSSAQHALRSMMEEFSSNARFILTCNKLYKIINELRSRCTEVHFPKIDKNSMAIKAAKILKKEKIKIPSIDLLDKYVDESRGDFRKLLNILQDHSYNGELAEKNVSDEFFELKAEAMLYMEMGEWNTARKLLCEKLSNEDFDEMYTFLYKNISNLDKFKDVKSWKQAIVIIAEYLYRNDFCADKEINFSACMIRLSEI